MIFNILYIVDIPWTYHDTQVICKQEKQIYLKTKIKKIKLK